MDEEKATMPVNSTNGNVQIQHQVATPATTYLLSQEGGYHPVYTMDVGYQNQAVSRPCCKGAFQPAEQTAMYDDMDLYSLKPNVKVDFAETFQEPKEAESFDVVWKYNKAIYYWTMRCFYNFLTGILGPFLAITWGLIFATMNFVVIWGVNPSLKLIFQFTRIIEVLVRSIVRSVFDPIFQSFGQIFTYLRGNFSLNLKGTEGLFGKPTTTTKNSMPIFLGSRA